MNAWIRRRLDARKSAELVIRYAQVSARRAISETASVINASQLGTTKRYLTLKGNVSKNSR